MTKTTTKASINSVKDSCQRPGHEDKGHVTEDRGHTTTKKSDKREGRRDRENGLEAGQRASGHWQLLLVLHIFIGCASRALRQRVKWAWLWTVGDEVGGGKRENIRQRCFIE